MNAASVGHETFETTLDSVRTWILGALWVGGHCRRWSDLRPEPNNDRHTSASATSVAGNECGSISDKHAVRDNAEQRKVVEPTRLSRKSVGKGIRETHWERDRASQGRINLRAQRPEAPQVKCGI